MLRYARASLVFYNFLKLFDISRAFLPLTVAKLPMLKKVQFFWPTM